ncbi:MAG: LacI family DNA-binding transcriptional regulator [Ruthenibacterium lactatiformans]
MTIKDIARESGYAVSTVSRALNDHPDVSREAKEKIKAIVAAHKFVPNSNARQLKVQQNRSIIIVVKGAFNMFFAAILERMQSLISCSGYSAEVHYLDEDADEVLVGEQLQRERKPLGFIFLGGNTCSFEARFSAIAVPSVLATTLADHLNFGNLSSVGIDDTAAGRRAGPFSVFPGTGALPLSAATGRSPPSATNATRGSCRALQTRGFPTMRRCIKRRITISAADIVP